LHLRAVSAAHPPQKPLRSTFSPVKQARNRGELSAAPHAPKFSSGLKGITERTRPADRPFALGTGK